MLPLRFVYLLVCSSPIIIIKKKRSVAYSFAKRNTTLNFYYHHYVLTSAIQYQYSTSFTSIPTAVAQQDSTFRRHRELVHRAPASSTCATIVCHRYSKLFTISLQGGGGKKSKKIVKAFITIFFFFFFLSFQIDAACFQHHCQSPRDGNRNEEMAEQAEQGNQKRKGRKKEGKKKLFCSVLFPLPLCTQSKTHTHAHGGTRARIYI